MYIADYFLDRSLLFKDQISLRHLDNVSRSHESPHQFMCALIAIHANIELIYFKPLYRKIIIIAANYQLVSMDVLTECKTNQYAARTFLLI